MEAAALIGLKGGDVCASGCDASCRTNLTGEVVSSTPSVATLITLLPAEGGPWVTANRQPWLSVRHQNPPNPKVVLRSVGGTIRTSCALTTVPIMCNGDWRS